MHILPVYLPEKYEITNVTLPLTARSHSDMGATNPFSLFCTCNYPPSGDYFWTNWCLRQVTGIDTPSLSPSHHPPFHLSFQTDVQGAVWPLFSLLSFCSAGDVISGLFLLEFSRKHCFFLLASTVGHTEPSGAELIRVSITSSSSTGPNFSSAHSNMPNDVEDISSIVIGSVIIQRLP